jgi:hypothetical protein
MQSERCVLPVPSVKLFAGQSEQAWLETAPTACEYVRKGHSTQAIDDLKMDLNVPAGQAVAFSPEPVNPASARQSELSTEPAGLSVLAGHRSHVSDVCASRLLYLPAMQSLHGAEETGNALNLPAEHTETSLPEPVYPAWAKQSSKASAPLMAVCELCGQLSQVSDV